MLTISNTCVIIRTVNKVIEYQTPTEIDWSKSLSIKYKFC